mmetsp:Transcript_16527/g.18677  ORF Transcript_16527/g.18677 Transcript_16527/m.18677 type:complete len:81 (-) Transcript_16527:331-573(-)|eukprot:CAMPEP_0184019248 /NCGR_PEP_ID=MMETSP0954-20121128/8638_1 /TAXON_ID=627963 /ORGANISM="Aplanochytrium sp, Strain PBS07" /LENGTH=80 /DNA_ID=CAMNT_0026300877 /DNA_START=190 /DNA_END=432 /DNA_ORIENTATION=-
MSKRAAKVVALGTGLVCATAAIGMGVYLPFYSQAARQGEGARRKLHDGSGGAQGVTAGGVWSNLDKIKKSQQASRKTEDE